APGNGSDKIHVSPLQMVLASAALSNDGTIPAPRMALAVNTPRDGWVVLPALGKPIGASQPSGTEEAVLSFVSPRNNYWSHVGRAAGAESPVTWFIGGTLANWQASPLAIVVLLEENNPREAERIGGELLVDAMYP
ncbi:MAG: hypothetical protein L6Q26_06785, partial [Anaerolineales bacterium]|nr:hypothetical protein [Anaerolineales bacterium]